MKTQCAKTLKFIFILQFFFTFPIVIFSQKTNAEEFNFVTLSHTPSKQLSRINNEPEADGGWRPFHDMPIPVGATILRQQEIPSLTPTIESPSPVPARDFLAYIDPLQTIPPDPHGAVGLNHVVTASNDSILVHTKTGVVISRMSFATFFDNTTISDPYMQYDPYLDRYWVSGISSETTNKVFIAVSRNGDPSGNWFRFSFTPASADGPILMDHPYLGFDNKLLVIGGRKFPGAASFTGTILFCFDKTSLAAGNAIAFGTNAQTIEKSPTDGDAPCPVTAYGLSSIPAPAFYIVQNWSGGASSIRLSMITGDIPNLTWNTGAAAYASGGSPWADDNLGNLASQVDESRKVAVNDARISSAVMLNGKIWCAHHIGLPAGAPDHTAVQWWQLSALGEVLQRARIDDPTGKISRYFPTIAANPGENVLIGYTISSPSTRINAAYSTRTATTPVNTLDDEYIYKGGVSPYWKDFGSGRARWGDYSHTVLDPVTGSLWTIQQYAEQRGGSADNQSKYGLWWAEVSFNTLNNDAALSAIIDPNIAGPYCDIPLKTKVTINNIGRAVLNSVSVGLILDGINLGTQTFKSLSLDHFQTTNLNIDIPLNPLPGNHLLKVYTFNPNGGQDQVTSNDTASVLFTTLPFLALPNKQTFENGSFPPPGGWSLFNPDGGITWERTVTAGRASSSSMRYNAFDYTAKGQKDILRSPKINVATVDTVHLNFDVAYARHSVLDNDSLVIQYSTDCGRTWLNTTYAKGGAGLATLTAIVTDPFVPASTDWRNENVDIPVCGLSDSNILLGIKAVNDYGNIIYLDNLSLTKSDSRKSNASLLSINMPTENICTPAFTPEVNIINNGSDILNSLKINYRIDNGNLGTYLFTGTLSKCESRSVSLDPLNAAPGQHTLTIYLTEPNGVADQSTANDTLVKSFTISPVLEAPVSEGFESPEFPPVGWTVLNEDKSLSWERSTNAAKTGSASMVIRNYDYTAANGADKFVSPIVIFDPLADSFFVSFDYANAPGLQYPGSTNFPLDTLEVQLTQDCGQTFTTIWKKWGGGLQTINSPNFPNGNLFVPGAPSQWQNVNLYISPALNASNFQVYLVGKSNHQNNLYIDNINIYKKILPQRLKSQGYLIYPNPFSQSFIVRHARPPANLQSIAVYNSVGQLVHREDLNGTGITEITVDVAGLAKGMYIVKLFYKDKTEVERIIKQ